jgi:hypothetical protein
MGFIWSYFGGTVEDTEFCWGRDLVPKGKKCAPPDQGGFYRGRAPSMVDPPNSEDVPGYPGEQVARQAGKPRFLGVKPTALNKDAGEPFRFADHKAVTGIDFDERLHSTDGFNACALFVDRVRAVAQCEYPGARHILGHIATGDFSPSGFATTPDRNDPPAIGVARAEHH